MTPCLMELFRASFIIRENVEEAVIFLPGWLKGGKPLLVALMLILLSVEQ